MNNNDAWMKLMNTGGDGWGGKKRMLAVTSENDYKVPGTECWALKQIFIELNWNHSVLRYFGHSDLLSSGFLELVLCSCLKHCLRETVKQYKECGSACRAWGESWKGLLTNSLESASLMSWKNRHRDLQHLSRGTATERQLRSTWWVFWPFFFFKFRAPFHFTWLVFQNGFAVSDIPGFRQPPVLEFWFHFPLNCSL